MRKADLIKLFNKEQRIEADYPGVRKEFAGPIIRSLSIDGIDNCIIYSELDDRNADEAIEDQLRYFRQQGMKFEWKVYDFDRPHDLKDRLIARGFNPGEAEALLILELQPDHELLRLPIPSSIRRVTDSSKIDGIIALEDSVWEESHQELGKRLKEELSSTPEQLAIFVAEHEGQTVSAAWMYFHEGTSFCSLWGGATLELLRGQGHYKALLAARAQHAWNHGYRMLMVEASPMSRPILEQKGFVFLGYSYPCMSP
ncbi:GNAT family N-acetyltransferase [Paenibacillus sp. J22TS3]|uniref:GNAT family N-acetyltransferase n=1 Tax=Paenibacillus sp. J22TS3 TaxID=2807192 RepID=UPI001B2DA76E|nr:GNAT family N-acetyltransferase [Paenibacillus sp. J22TS3]GIP22207.1 hypothetical protein J22TS3_24820 [Paenibacillus sp. J22TS3]